MTNLVDVLVQPIVVRFRLQDDEIVYLFASGADAQLDRMERMIGIDPSSDSLFDSNLGFLPVSTTVLIRGERNVIVDPGNHHIGFYGQLSLALERFGLTPSDIDIVICTHCHHDHMANAPRFPGKQLVLGEGEVAHCSELYGEYETRARIAPMSELIEVPRNGSIEICKGVEVLSTPGHTPGSLCVMVESESERVAVTGDTAMTRSEYEDRAFSHWYSRGQIAELNTSIERLEALEPTLVLPGHDRAFLPRRRT